MGRSYNIEAVTTIKLISEEFERIVDETGRIKEKTHSGLI